MRFSGPPLVMYCGFCKEFDRNLKLTSCPKCGETQKFFMAYQSRKTSDSSNIVGNPRWGKDKAIELTNSILKSFQNDENYLDIEKNLRDFQLNVDGLLMDLEIDENSIWTASHLLPIISMVDFNDFSDTFDEKVIQILNEIKLFDSNLSQESLSKNNELSFLGKILKIIQIISISRILKLENNLNNIPFILEKENIDEKNWKIEKCKQLKHEWNLVFTNDVINTSKSKLFTSKEASNYPKEISVFNDNGVYKFFNLGKRALAFYLEENSTADGWNCRDIEKILKSS